ncbi:COG3 protein, partial [Polyodon spathula]|nr:COG3 protein [Polyodon spathula]
MAALDPSQLDLNEKGTREKLSLWDRRSDGLAPLTERQTDSVLEIQAAAENLTIPTEVRETPGLFAVRGRVPVRLH